LNWAGNPNHARDRERSRLLSEFKPLATIPNIDFYSLQVGPAAAQLAETTMQITDLATGFKNMSDTAAAMQALDLVISIDSAPAHLAGALGLPIWVLLTKAPDWRWGLENETTPWYPSMRIFRDQAGWDDVFDRVATALAEFAPDR
jgi:ADP-heptose:LPS heptosyltransferase